MRTFVYNSACVMTADIKPVEVQREILRYVDTPNVPCNRIPRGSGVGYLVLPGRLLWRTR